MKHLTCLTLICCCCLTACDGDDRRNIADYYFPLEELKTGKVYEYRSIGNQNDPPMYWYYHTLSTDTADYLVGTAYDFDLNPDQLVREERVSNGMLLADFYTYESDSTGKKIPVQARISAPNVFPFTVGDPPGVLLTSISWRTLGDSAQITLVRNRQFDSDTTYSFRGKSIPAVKFNTVELIEHETEGRLPLEFTGEEIYAKDIGLVYLRKNIQDGWVMIYELADIYPMERLEAMKRSE